MLLKQRMEIMNHDHLHHLQVLLLMVFFRFANVGTKRILWSYMEVLLVPLTNFSMPYNVITFTCPVSALYFGSLLNVLQRRIGEEERVLKSKGKSDLYIPRSCAE